MFRYKMHVRDVCESNQSRGRYVMLITTSATTSKTAQKVVHYLVM